MNTVNSHVAKVCVTGRLYCTGRDYGDHAGKFVQRVAAVRKVISTESHNDAVREHVAALTALLQLPAVVRLRAKAAAEDKKLVAEHAFAIDYLLDFLVSPNQEYVAPPGL